jgi:hypothetical protein
MEVRLFGELGALEGGVPVPVRDIRVTGFVRATARTGAHLTSSRHARNDRLPRHYQIGPGGKPADWIELHVQCKHG